MWDIFFGDATSDSNFWAYNSNMKWFRKTKFVHIPVSVPAYILYLISLVFLVSVFLAVDRGSHSVSDTLYGLFPYVVCVFLLIEWFADKNTR